MTAQTSCIDQLFGIAKRTEAQAKTEGMAAAEQTAPRHGYDMEEMRRWARFYIYSNQSLVDLSMEDRKRLRQSNNIVWADPIREHEFSFGNVKPMAGTDNNCMGSLFTAKHPDPAKCFVWTGEYVNSRTEGAHCRPVKTWTLPEYKGQDANKGSLSVPNRNIKRI